MELSSHRLDNSGKLVSIQIEKGKALPLFYLDIVPLMKPCRLPCQVNLPDSHPYEVAGQVRRLQIVCCRADPSSRWAESAKRDQMGVCSGVISQWGSQPGSSLDSQHVPAMTCDFAHFTAHELILYSFTVTWQLVTPHILTYICIVKLTFDMLTVCG